MRNEIVKLIMQELKTINSERALLTIYNLIVSIKKRITY